MSTRWFLRTALVRAAASASKRRQPCAPEISGQENKR